MKEILGKIIDEFKKDEITPETEYNALREEKLFRYGYSNSVNTTLLTITLAVFSVGALMFTMSNNTFAELAEVFFPLFFLLPCLFARICFRSLLKNSIRIGLLSEYIRSHIPFNDDISWEKIKKEKEINYFLNPDQYIGGVKEVPICITAVSLIFSAIIAHYFIYQSVSDKKYFLLLILALIPIIVAFYPLSTANSKGCKVSTITLLVTSEIIIYALFFVYLNCGWQVILHQAIYHIILICVLCMIPNFEKEIAVANQNLKDYKDIISNYPKENKNEK